MGQIVAGGEQFETHIEADHRGQLLQKGPDSGSLENATGLIGWREFT